MSAVVTAVLRAMGVLSVVSAGCPDVRSKGSHAFALFGNCLSIVIVTVVLAGSAAAPAATTLPPASAFPPQLSHRFLCLLSRCC